MDRQDVALTLATLALSIGLVPAIFGRNKPPLSTNLISFFAMTVVAAVDASLRLWLTFVVVCVCTFGWLILTCQVAERRRRWAKSVLLRGPER